MKTILTKTKNLNLTKIIKTTAIIGFLVFIVGYAVLNTRLISKGINLKINGIENGKIYEESSIDITGNAKRARHVLVNGREINLNQEGEFSDVLIILPGYNIITISAEDKFGKITKQVFEIIRKEN